MYSKKERMNGVFGFKGKKFSSGYDLLVVALGNPGREYENTRHNVGFLAADVLLSSAEDKRERTKFRSLITDCKIKGYKVLVAKPQTYMNLSGEAVREIVSFYKIPTEKIVVLCDDTAIDAGRLRIRKKGSAGGHNGLKNIILNIGTDEFIRIKIGVGSKPHPDYDLKDWVLSAVTGEDAKPVRDAIDRAAKATESILLDGIDKAMNKYNS